MVHALRKRILTQILEVRSKNPKDLAGVETTFLWFPIPDAMQTANIILEIGDRTVRGQCAETGSSVSQPLLQESLRAWQVDVLANQLVLAAVGRDIDILHGCSIEVKGRALLFVGGSGTGKTTLALELSKLGYPLLCEGQIPIDRRRALVKPFPRGLSLHIGKLSELTASVFKVEERVPSPLKAAYSQVECPIHSIFFLQDLFPGISLQDIELGCPTEEKEPFEILLVEQGAVEVHSWTCDSLALIRCRFDPGQGKNLNAFYQAVRESRLNPFFLSSTPLPSPDWNRPLIINGISTAAATLGLAANTHQTSFRSWNREGDSGALKHFPVMLKTFKPIS